MLQGGGERAPLQASEAFFEGATRDGAGSRHSLPLVGRGVSNRTEGSRWHPEPFHAPTGNEGAADERGTGGDARGICALRTRSYGTAGYGPDASRLSAQRGYRTRTLTRGASLHCTARSRSLPASSRGRISIVSADCTRDSLIEQRLAPPVPMVSSPPPHLPAPPETLFASTLRSSKRDPRPRRRSMLRIEPSQIPWMPRACDREITEA